MDLTFTQLLIQYHGWGIYFGSLLFGQVTILTAFYFSGQGLWSPATVWILSFLGVITADLFWLFFGFKFLEVTRQWKFWESKYKRIDAALALTDKKDMFKVLLFRKFIYGVPFLILLYVVSHKVNLKKLILYDVTGTTIWLTVLFLIGWLSGKGIYNLIPIYTQASYILLIVVIVYVLFRIVRKKFQRNH